MRRARPYRARSETGTYPSWSAGLARELSPRAPLDAGRSHDRQARYRYWFSPVLSGRRDNARSCLQAARRQWDVGGDTDVGGRDVFRDPVVSCVCVVADENHAHIRGPSQANWSRAIGNHENMKSKARRHAINLFAHRTRIAVNVNVSQFSARVL